MADGMVTDGGALFARKGEAAPTDARPVSLPQDGHATMTGPEACDPMSEGSAILDLRNLIRRKRPSHAANHQQFIAVSPVTPEVRQPDRPGRPSAPPGKGDARIARIHRRHQLTVRLWSEEFERIRVVASMAHTTYQEVLASAAVIFLDHVVPHDGPSNEEHVAERWQRLKGRATGR